MQKHLPICSKQVGDIQDCSVCKPTKSPNFNIAVNNLLIKEGGYSNHSADKGGETKFGISKKSYPNLDIVNLTKEKAVQIYKNDFWKTLKLDKFLSHIVAERVFDIGVNMGIKTAGKMLQKSLNVLGHSLIEDGIIGNLTINAVNSIKNPNALVTLLIYHQVQRYLDIVSADKTQKIFLAGWLNRVSI